MSHLNVEIKARCQHPARVREYLQAQHADFKGVDLQVDTYFNVTNGRLKLREGNIENNLIFYERTDSSGPKDSHFNLVKVDKSGGIKEVLERSLGVKVVVRKTREIYYIRNVKFHIDEVPGLGSFVEIEAGNLSEDIPAEELRIQCDFYMNALEIEPEDLLTLSYSDMLLQLNREKGR